MSDDEEFNTCPLCEEEMDLSDKNFLPCPCGYRVCMWCWHHIRENLNGLCPACRTPYNSDPHAFSAVDRQLIVKKNRERKQKEKIEKKVMEKSAISAGKVAGAVVDRKHLHNFRVVQRNLLYVIGLPLSAANEELLKKAEYFGQYGKITKVVAHKNTTSGHPTASAYVTFAYKEDAKAAIQALDGFWIEGHPLRASFGTTKYCNNFIKNTACGNPECVYLHELGDDDDRFTKEEIQAGHTKLAPTPGKDQILVTGCGGPSGTGKRPAGETVLPPPVFIQEANPVKKSSNQIETKDNFVESVVESKQVNQVEKVTAASSSNQNPAIGQSSSSSSNLSPTQSTSVESKADNNSKTKAPSPEKKVVVISKAGEKNTLSEVESYSPVPTAAVAAASKSSNSSTESDPVSIAVQEPVIDEKADGKLMAEFNGLTLNAVFPVPSSSLTITVWSNILRSSSADGEWFSSNPFSKVLFPFSELIDLTIPPVDASIKPNIKVFQEEEMLNVNFLNKSEGISSTSDNLNGGEKNNLHEESSKSENASNPSFTALRQLFPGVNLAYGVVPGQTQLKQTNIIGGGRR